MHSLILKSFLLLSLSFVFAVNMSKGKEPFYPDASYDHQFHVVLSAGIKNGGDSLQQVVQVTTGEVIEKLRVGGFFNGNLGVLVPLGEDNPFSLQATVGYIYDQISSNINVDDRASFQRSTAELIAFYNWGRQRIGVGATAHFNPKFKQRATIGDFQIDFDNAVGGYIQYDLMYDQHISGGIRADYIEYKLGNTVLKAPSIGLHLNYSF